MISQTAEYALRAMMFLASRHGTIFNSQAVAKSARVSQSYMSKVLRDLADAELLQTSRGPHGGFALARDPSKITILQVLDAVDPHRAKRRRSTAASDSELPAVHELLDEALASIECSFRDTSLSELLDKAAEEQRRIPRRLAP